MDDAIVVVENTYRIFENGRRPILQATNEAAAEVFIPVLSGTLITAAPFVPLLFWNSIPGKFLYYLPVTFLITLLRPFSWPISSIRYLRWILCGRKSPVNVSLRGGSSSR